MVSTLEQYFSSGSSFQVGMGKDSSARDRCWLLQYEHGLILVKLQQTAPMIVDPTCGNSIIQIASWGLPCQPWYPERNRGAWYSPRTWQYVKIMQHASALPATSRCMVAHLWPCCWVVLCIYLIIFHSSPKKYLIKVSWTLTLDWSTPRLFDSQILHHYRGYPSNVRKML